MKIIIAICLILSSLGVYAQNYADSNITIQAPRCFAWWVAKSIESNFSKSNFRMLDALKHYVGDTTKPDSLFTVTLKARYVKGAMERLISRPLLVAIDDYRSIVLDQPDIANYTGLAQQITAKANGSTSEKNVAKWLLDWFNERKAAYQALYDEEKTKVIQWSNY